MAYSLGVTLVVATLVAIALVVGVCLVWRQASWPCPPRLALLLENPYIKAVAGAEALLDRAGVRKGMRVLDAGCGPGRVSLPAAKRVGPSGAVVGLDIQPGMIERLRRRADAGGLANVTPLLAGLGEGRLPAGEFDVALLVAVLGEIPDKLGALREIRRSLRPGGVLSVTEILPDPHYQRLARVRALAAEAGFREAALFRGRLAYTVNLA